MRLDGCGGPFHGNRFNNVRVESSLHQIRNFAVCFVFLQLQGLVGEDGNKFGADELAFALGIGDALELGEKALGGVDADHAQAETVAQHFQRVFELVFAQQAGVDEDVGEAVADGAVDEHGGNGGTATPRGN